MNVLTKRVALPLRRVLLSIALLLSPLSTYASEKVFLSLTNTCYVAGGQVWGSSNNQNFYSEVLGSTNGLAGQMCVKGMYFNARTCTAATLYNFQIACRGGLASAPQFYMAVFGKDPNTQKNGFAVSGNQLSYVDPAPNCSSFGCRVQFPPGYAPLHTGPIDAFLRRLTWDDINRRPSLSRALSGDQERRVQQLFVAAPGYVEPFPESNIKRAFDISEEPPPPAPAPSLPPPAVASVTAPGPAPVSSSGFTFEPNSGVAVGMGFVFAAFLSWVLALVSRLISGEGPNPWRQIGVQSVSLVISGVALYSFGIVDEIKLLSIPLFGGVSVAVISSLSSS